MSAPQEGNDQAADAADAVRTSPPVPLAAAVQGGAHRVVEELTGAGPGDRDTWLTVAGDCQSLINTLTAVQDRALCEVARREHIWAEDGTLGEVVHAPGRVSIDAADLVAPVIGASHAQAQHRVQQAVRVAAGRAPVEVDDAEHPEATGLGGLHAAMVAGRLDGYRAGVIADELEAAPPEVADAIVSALGAHLDADAPALRRRTRQLVARISPDLLRQRAKRARSSTGLRRWVAEPGVDAWFGTFPSEDAATAWAAVDRLAHDLVADGTCSSVEQARGRALTDLVTGSSTVDVQVVLTVPADTSGTDHSGAEPRPSASSARDAADDLVEVQGARPSEPLLVRRGWLRDHWPEAPSRPRRGAKRARPLFVPCDPLTGARLDGGDALSTAAYRPGQGLAAMVRARDGRCRFPGCGVAARFCDLDHVRPWPIGRTAARNLLTLCRRHHRIKQRPGWRVHLAPNGTATWTDPTGRVRSTAPLDALHALVLADTTRAVGDDPAAPAHDADGADTLPVSSPEDGTARAPGATTASDAPPPSSTWSALETRVELLLEHRPVHRRCTSAAQLRTASARSHRRAPVHDPPPF